MSKFDTDRAATGVHDDSGGGGGGWDWLKLVLHQGLLAPADHLPERDNCHVVPEPKGRRPVQRGFHVHNRLHFVPVGGEDVAELGQELVAGDHQLGPSLVQPVHHRLLAQVGVQGDHWEALPEAGLGGHHPLHPCVREQADILSGLLTKGSETPTKSLSHGVCLVVAEPPVVAQVELGEHLPVGLYLVLLPKHFPRPHQALRVIPYSRRGELKEILFYCISHLDPSANGQAVSFLDKVVNDEDVDDDDDDVDVDVEDVDVEVDVDDGEDDGDDAVNTC